MSKINKWLTPLKDSYHNFALQLGIKANNPTSDSKYSYSPLTLNRLQLEWMYRSSWAAKAIIEIPAKAMCKTGVTLHGLTSKQSDLIQKEFSDLNIWTSISETLTWARLYGGAVGYIMIDGQNPATPLNTSTIRPGQFKGIMPLSRWQLNPLITQPINDYGPDFGLPENYQILATNDLSAEPVTVHHSRMLRFIGIQQPYFQKISLLFWGLSVLENLQDRIEAYDMITTSINQLSNKAHLRTLKIDGLRDNIAMGDEALNNILTYVNQLRLTQTSEGITLLDKDDELEMQGYNFSGLAEILNLAGEQIAAAAGIPQSLFFGRQADGLGASHSGDIENFYSTIAQAREHELRRPIGKLIEIIAKSNSIELAGDFAFSFDNLWDDSSDEIAEIANKTSSTLVSLVTSGIISVEEAREELHGQALSLKMFGDLEPGKIPEPKVETPEPTEEKAK